MLYTVIASEIGKSFGRQVVLDGKGFEVDSGTVFALLCPHGAGKSTRRLLNTIATPGKAPEDLPPESEMVPPTSTPRRPRRAS